MHFNPNQAREIIMAHYKEPKFKAKLEANFQTYFSTTCSDKLQLSLKFENNYLTKAKFDGHGCAIFVASTDILLDTLLNKSKTEILEIISLYTEFLNDPSKYTQETIKDLVGLWVFFNVKKHLSRLNCALLSANSIKEEIEKTL